MRKCELCHKTMDQCACTQETVEQDDFDYSDEARERDDADREDMEQQAEMERLDG